MRRFVSLFLLLLILCPFNPAQAAWKTANQRHVQTGEATDLLFSDWDNMLQTVNKQNQLILWGLGNIEKYIAQPTWENLCTARVSCAVVSEALDLVSWPDKKLSDEELLRLSQSGVPVEIYISDFQEMDFRQSARVFRSIHALLETSWYISSCVDQIRNHCKLWKRYVQSGSTFLIVETNYLYLYLFSNPEQAEEKADRWSHSDTYIWANSTNQLEINESLFYDRYIEAKQQIDNLQNASQSDDGIGSWATSVSLNVSNLPQLLPMPAWLTIEYAELRYFSQSDIGEISAPQYGNSIDILSEYLEMSDVSLAQVEEWMDQIEPYTEDLHREGNSWYITTRDYSFSLWWTEQSARLVFDKQLCTFADAQYINGLHN